jgi:hypothetical protein
LLVVPILPPLLLSSLSLRLKAPHRTAPIQYSFMTQHSGCSCFSYS